MISHSFEIENRFQGFLYKLTLDSSNNELYHIFIANFYAKV